MISLTPKTMVLENSMHYLLLSASKSGIPLYLISKRQKKEKDKGHRAIVETDTTFP